MVSNLLDTVSGLDFAILQRIYDLPVPREKRTQKNICVFTKYHQKVCYDLPTQNIIQCNSELCKINYKSQKRELAYKSYPEGIHSALTKGGAFGNPHIFGIFKREDLPQIQNIFPDVPIVRVSENINPTLGLEKPPKKCRYLPWTEPCIDYWENGWDYSFLRGWKPPNPYHLDL